MSVEKARGCGYRKIGGIYMVSGAFSATCDRLPLELSVCPCCGQGIKQSLGFTWVDPNKLFGGNHNSGGAYSHCACPSSCAVCNPVLFGEKAGLMWVGKKFYKTTADFLKESAEMGISKRIRAVPRDFKVGETWLLLAHPEAVKKDVIRLVDVKDEELREEMIQNGETERAVYAPGIFAAFRPERVEMLIQESKATVEELEALKKRGITPIIVPDNDPDHVGSVHDSKKKKKAREEEMKQESLFGQPGSIPEGEE